jgi:transcriptional regulator with XRE-family HTH domain
MNTGNNIKTIRMLKNLTQKHVANQLGISEKWLGEMENEKVEISKVNLQKLSQTYRMDIMEIVHFHENPIFNITSNNCILGNNNNYTNESVEKLVDLYKKLLEEKDKLIEAKNETIILLQEKVRFYKIKKNNSLNNEKN